MRIRRGKQCTLYLNGYSIGLQPYLQVDDQASLDFLLFLFSLKEIIRCC